MSWRSAEGFPAVRYRPIDGDHEGEEARRLFERYRRWIADHADPGEAAAARVREGLASLDPLLWHLRSAYGAPKGEILLGYEKQELIACGALRELRPGIGELTRVYLREEYRGGEFGRPFVRAHVEKARELGYLRLRSYVLPSMAAAIEFFEELGFRRIPAYWPHPASGTIFFERVPQPRGGEPGPIRPGSAYGPGSPRDRRSRSTYSSRWAGLPSRLGTCSV